MKKKDKIEWLRKYHPEKWYTVRSEIKNKLSDAQHIFCCCGAIASGLHEDQCRRFNAKIDTETIAALKYLLPNR